MSSEIDDTMVHAHAYYVSTTDDPLAARPCAPPQQHQRSSSSFLPDHSTVTPNRRAGPTVETTHARLVGVGEGPYVACASGGPAS